MSIHISFPGAVYLVVGFWVTVMAFGFWAKNDSDPITPWRQRIRLPVVFLALFVAWPLLVLAFFVDVQLELKGLAFATMMHFVKLHGNEIIAIVLSVVIIIVLAALVLVGLSLRLDVCRQLDLDFWHCFLAWR